MGTEPLPPTFSSPQELLDFIQQYGLNAFPDEFTRYFFGDDGNVAMQFGDTNMGYNPMGTYGLWFNYSEVIYNGREILKSVGTYSHGTEFLWCCC